MKPISKKVIKDNVADVSESLKSKDEEDKKGRTRLKEEPIGNEKSDLKSELTDNKERNLKSESEVKPVRSSTDCPKAGRSKRPIEETEKTPPQCDSTRRSKKEAKVRIKKDADFKVPPVHPKTFFSNLKGTKEEKPLIQTVVSSSSKVFNLESKKIIFKKNTTPTPAEEKEDASPRKSEAFSPDNENSVYAFEPDLPTTSPPFRRLKPATPSKSVISNSIAVQVSDQFRRKYEIFKHV